MPIPITAKPTQVIDAKWIKEQKPGTLKRGILSKWRLDKNSMEMFWLDVILDWHHCNPGNNTVTVDKVNTLYQRYIMPKIFVEQFHVEDEQLRGLVWDMLVDSRWKWDDFFPALVKSYDLLLEAGYKLYPIQVGNTRQLKKEPEVRPDKFEPCKDLTDVGNRYLRWLFATLYDDGYKIYTGEKARRRGRGKGKKCRNETPKC